MKVNIDRNTCIGCGACQAICNDVFEYDDDGIMNVKTEIVAEDLTDDVTYIIA